MSFDVNRAMGAVLGVEFQPAAIRRCANRCIFCFIDQMPPGLRSGLYIKDEDLTHSFINGNYVTLASAREYDLRKIVRTGLSPLFISVHATDLPVRRRMLGNNRAPDIMGQLQVLSENGIRFHTQIVVCPGYNDSGVLNRTLADLLSFGDGLLSIAVVPVGLTRFRKVPLRPVEARSAGDICTLVSRASDRDRERFGIRRIFLADELLLKAGLPIPGTDYYEDYPQIENGVGLVRSLLDSWNTAKRRVRGRKRTPRRIPPEKRYFLATSVSAFPTLKKIAKEVGQHCRGVTVNPITIPNRFFGELVTVAGLMCAGDVIRAVAEAKQGAPIDGVLLPAVMFNYAGFTLDGYSAARIEKACGVPVTIIEEVGELLEL
jgi:putative radical SAM enzyme (TIGR03279 family)